MEWGPICEDERGKVRHFDLRYTASCANLSHDLRETARTCKAAGGDA
jgi:hypothetical protein